MNVGLFDKIEAVSGSLQKKILLTECDDVDKIFLKWALDPMITFGVTFDEDVMLDEYLTNDGKPECGPWWGFLDDTLEQLSKRELTGNSAKSVITGLMRDAPNMRCVIWAGRVINKDLRMGVNLATVRKVFPDLIKIEVPCALAVPFDPNKHEISGNWAIEPKLDGLRMVVIDGVAFTRNGRTIETVGHILNELKLAQFEQDFVFDGEVMGKTEFNEDSGAIRRKSTGTNESLVYNVFDMVPRQSWMERNTSSTRCRKKSLELLKKMELKHVRVVPWKELPLDPTPEQLFKLRDEFIAQGYEGAMLKDLDAPYIFKRSDSLIKLKDFVDGDGVITAWYEGKGKHKGRLGGFTAVFDGVETHVGGGYTDKQRTEFWGNREQMVGRWMEAQYQNLTPKGKLRFGVFIKMRPDRDPV